MQLSTIFLICIMTEIYFKVWLLQANKEGLASLKLLAFRRTTETSTVWSKRAPSCLMPYPFSPLARDVIYRLVDLLQDITSCLYVDRNKPQAVFFFSPTRNSSFSAILLFRSSRPAWLLPGDATAGQRGSGPRLNIRARLIDVLLFTDV